MCIRDSSLGLGCDRGTPAATIAQAISDALIACDAVSYTHLDVYKRQVVTITNLTIIIVSYISLKFLQFIHNFIEILILFDV